MEIRDELWREELIEMYSVCEEQEIECEKQVEDLKAQVHCAYFSVEWLEQQNQELRKQKEESREELEGVKLENQELKRAEEEIHPESKRLEQEILLEKDSTRLEQELNKLLKRENQV